MFTKSTVSQSMIDAVNSILEEEKKQQQLNEASTFDWKSNKNETDPKFTTKKSGERTGHESKKTEKGVQYTKKLSKGPAEDSPMKEDSEVSFKERLLEKNWIAGAIKKPGAETAAAKKAGMSVQSYAHKHAHDSGKAGQRARLAITLSKLKKEEATFDELLEDLNDAQVDKLIYEVLGKDADAGDYIHDFIHSKNPKFAGKSKEMRKKMALGAYYSKKNEDFELHPEAGKVLKHIKPEHQAKYKPDLAKSVYKGDYADRTAVLKAAKAAGHLNEEVEIEEAADSHGSSNRQTLVPSKLQKTLDKQKEKYGNPNEYEKYSPKKDYSGRVTSTKEEVEIDEATWAKEELIGGQKKIDKNHNGKIDAQDFKILRGQKQKNESVMDTVKKVGGKVLKTLGHGSDADMMKDLAKKTGVNPPPKTKTEEAESPEAFTDTLAGRVKGGKPNQHSSIKVKLKAESAEKPPFDPPYRTAKSKDHNVKDKSGAVHTPMSQAKHLARLAMKKVKTEMLGKPGTSE